MQNLAKRIKRVFSELKALKPKKIGAARCNAIKWTKNRSKMVHSQIIGG